MEDDDRDVLSRKQEQFFSAAWTLFSRRAVSSPKQLEQEEAEGLQEVLRILQGANAWWEFYHGKRSPESVPGPASESYGMLVDLCHRDCDLGTQRRFWQEVCDVIATITVVLDGARQDVQSIVHAVGFCTDVALELARLRKRDAND